MKVLYFKDSPNGTGVIDEIRQLLQSPVADARGAAVSFFRALAEMEINGQVLAQPLNAALYPISTMVPPASVWKRARFNHHLYLTYIPRDVDRLVGEIRAVLASNGTDPESARASLSVARHNSGSF